VRPNRRKNQLRVIAGTWRGRRLSFAGVPGLRPTPDRVRETLFNWLAPVMRGAHCLDLFAGSGALGFEAASRGAAAVTLVDDHAEIVRCLRQQAGLLEARQVSVVQAGFRAFLCGRASRMDIVFLDPPYRERWLPACIELLESGGWLADVAWIYLESGRSGAPELPANWEHYRRTTAGQVSACLVRRRKPA